MMMVSLDGDPVALRDTVHDVVYGTGTVVELMPDGRFAVQFMTIGRRNVYNGQGYSRTNRGRTLYWHDPLLFVPQKSDTGWTLIKRLCRAVVDEARRP